MLLWEPNREPNSLDRSSLVVSGNQAALNELRRDVQRGGLQACSQRMEPDMANCLTIDSFKTYGFSGQGVEDIV